MRICLTVTRVRGEDGDAAPHDYVFDQDEVLVGRDEAVEVRLPDAAISQVHLRLQRRKGRLFALDAGSTNGTRLDGRALAPHVPVELAPDASLALGPFVIRLGSLAEAPLTGPEDTARLARRMVLEVLGAAAALHPSLEVVSGPGQGSRLEIPPGPPLLVGRDEECALRLADADASRRHLELRRQGERVLVRDLGSKNRVQRNGEQVEGPCLLSDGDELLVGSTLLRFSDPAGRRLGELSSQSARAAPAPPASPGAGPPPVALPPARGRPGADPSLALLVGGGLLLAAGVATLVYLLI